jgi:hypothetical protein
VFVWAQLPGQRAVWCGDARHTACAAPALPATGGCSRRAHCGLPGRLHRARGAGRRAGAGGDARSREVRRATLAAVLGRLSACLLGCVAARAHRHAAAACIGPHCMRSVSAAAAHTTCHDLHAAHATHTRTQGGRAAQAAVGPWPQVGAAATPAAALAPGWRVALAGAGAGCRVGAHVGGSC